MLLLLIFFSASKSEFRSRLIVGGFSGKNPIEKSILFAKMTLTTDKGVVGNGYKFFVSRTAHCLLSFAHVVDLTPKVVPYWMGKSYRALLWAPIPRAIFPWKPAITIGQEFGHRYSFLHPTDHTTSYNLSQLVEMYVNFGFIGIVIGMFLMGIIYRALYEMFCGPESGEGGLLIGIYIFTKLSIIESNFSTVFGNIIYFAILLVIINKLIETHD
jgi:hypothetical protein